MPNKPLLAFDVGGTTIKYALLTPELTLEQTGSVPTNKSYLFRYCLKMQLATPNLISFYFL